MNRLLLILWTLVFVCEFAFASVTVSVNGSNHTIPQTNEKGWGTNVTAWIQAISSNTLQPSGGTFTLTAEVNTGATYGFKVPYIKTATATPSTAGVLRLAVADDIGWRNNADDGNLLLSVDGSDRLTFNSVVIPTATAASVQDSTFSIYDNGDATKLIAFQASAIANATTRTITMPDANVDLTLVSSATDANTVSTIVKRDSSGNFSAGTISAALTGNASTATALASNPSDCSANEFATTIAASGNLTCAQPAVTNLVAITASRVAVTDGSGFLSAADTATYPSLTELSYVKGVTSAIQTQIATLSTSSSNPYKISNCSLTTSVGSSALTIALKDASGSDPSAGSPCTVSFRNVTAATGTYSDVAATAATSLVISNGSALGCLATVSCTVHVYLFNNAGTITLGASGKYFDEGTVQSSTAEGGAGAADSYAVIYSTAAHTSKSIRYIGRLTITPAASFAWTANSTEISPVPALKGDVLSGVNGERIERAFIVCNTGGSSITSQSGDWITSIATRGSFGCAITIATGVFSSTPMCVAHSSAAQAIPGMDYTSATSVSPYFTNSSNIFLNYAAAIICMGPR